MKPRTFKIDDFLVKYKDQEYTVFYENREISRFKSTDPVVKLLPLGITSRVFTSYDNEKEFKRWCRFQKRIKDYENG